MILAFNDEHALMGKISNNLEKHGEDDLITGFTLPIELRVPREQLVAFFGAGFDTAAWGADNTAADWVRRVLPLELAGEVYIGVEADIVCGDAPPMHFEGCRVTHVTLATLDPGGIARIKLHLYLRPGISNKNLLLQEYQEQEIAVRLACGALRVKADKPAKGTPAPEKDERQVDAFEEKGIPPEGSDLIAAIELEQVIGEHDHPEIGLKGCRCSEPKLGNRGLSTPENERERAHARERMIAKQLAAGRETPRDDDDGDEEEAAA